MQYRIKELDLYGIKKPFMILNGWIESSVSKISLLAKNSEVFSITFKQTKSKMHSFSARTALANCGLIANCQLVAYQGDKKIVLKSFKTTPFTRYQQSKHAEKMRTFVGLSLENCRDLLDSTLRINDDKSYQLWIKEKEQFHTIQSYTYEPLISIVMPVFNVAGKYLGECIDSILNQSYQNFEICIADDCSTNQDTIETLKYYMEKDKRIKVLFREKNGHISEATNSALTLAKGEFIGLMDNDDVLMPEALNEVVKALNENKNIDFIYTDEDKVDMNNNRSDPQFKSDFTLEKLYGGNYICHFSVIRKTIVDMVGGFRKGYEGAQDFDLFLRITELTNKFYHIPKVLYHWRMIPGSTALDSGSKNYAGEAGKRALEDLFEKKGKNVQVDILVHTHYNIEYITQPVPEVEFITYLNGNSSDFFTMCKSLREDLSYGKYIFNVITENPDEYADVVEGIKDVQFKLIQLDKSFIHSLNYFLSTTNCKYVLFLNEYAKIETFNAVEQMVGYSAQEEIGAVGCRINNHKGITVDSGYYLTGGNLIPLYHATYRDDYGIYGTLLVPNNYRLIEPYCVMLNTDLVQEMNFFDEDLPMREAFLDFFLRADTKGYKNMILPRVEVLLGKRYVHKIENLDIETLISKWKDNQINIYKDRFYNENVSNRISFRFDK